MEQSTNYNRITVYIADYVLLGLEHTWQRLFYTLPDCDRERIGRFRVESDRIRGTVGAFLIRRMAKKAFPDEEIAIARTQNGKPYVSGKDGYEFSLSHSGDMVVLAVSEVPVGVDVELVKEKNWRIFHRFLTKKEMTMIEEAEDPEGKFFEVWTIREAFSKEEGQGLQIFDDDFTVDYDKRSITYGDKELYFDRISHEVRETQYKISVCTSKYTNKITYRFLSKDDWDQKVLGGAF